jgi:2-keto-3-deoxy-L-fuconate dehydrogenase
MANGGNMGRLSGKRAFVTAAAAGMGRASVLAMRREGAEVIATDVDAAGLASLGGDTRLLDVTDAGAVQAMADAIGAVDILFNCAGIVPGGTILDGSVADWDRAFALNAKGPFTVTRAFLPAMLDNGGGSIIFMASIASSMIGVPNRCAYGASKAAAIGLMKSVAADFVTRGIRCNAICPGTVDTPSLQARLHATGDYEAARQAFTNRQPMGRLGTAEEVAELVVYLASDETAFMTGQAIAIDGGWTNV